MQHYGQSADWPYFLQQKVTSDYCAAYAVGMMLSLNGHPTMKQDSIRLFCACPRTWCPPNHQMVLSVMSRAMWPKSILLKRCLFATSSDFMQYVKRHISGHWPILTTAWCRLSDPRVSAEHAFILTGMRSPLIQILDPLGRPPTEESMCNATIVSDTTRKRTLTVDAARWDIDLRRPMSFFIVQANNGR